MLSMRSCQRPLRVMRSLTNRCPANASTNVSAVVATGRGIELGVLVTMTPARVIAATSTESFDFDQRRHG